MLTTTKGSIEHIGWVVSSIQDSREHFELALGLSFVSAEDFPDRKVAFFDGGGVLIELLEPLDQESDIGQFLNVHGAGIHHVALEVVSVASALAAAASRGWTLLDTEPRLGARGALVGFADPARPDGILIQYVQLTTRDPSTLQAIP